jgi:hypothetical protein
MRRIKNISKEFYSICFLLLTNLTQFSDALHASSFNKIELDLYNYQLAIENTLKIDSTSILNNDGNKDASQLIRIRTKHGQLYECQLPHVFDELENLNTDSQEEEYLRNYDNKNNYNFTLINEKITNQMIKLKKSKLCIYKV